jgi:hypothetical protein
VGLGEFDGADGAAAQGVAGGGQGIGHHSTTFGTA